MFLVLLLGTGNVKICTLTVTKSWRQAKRGEKKGEERERKRQQREVGMLSVCCIMLLLLPLLEHLLHQQAAILAKEPPLRGGVAQRRTLQPLLLQGVQLHPLEKGLVEEEEVHFFQIVF